MDIKERIKAEKYLDEIVILSFQNRYREAKQKLKKLKEIVLKDDVFSEDIKNGMLKKIKEAEKNINLLEKEFKEEEPDLSYVG